MQDWREVSLSNEFLLVRCAPDASTALQLVELRERKRAHSFFAGPSPLVTLEPSPSSLEFQTDRADTHLQIRWKGTENQVRGQFDLTLVEAAVQFQFKATGFGGHSLCLPFLKTLFPPGLIPNAERVLTPESFHDAQDRPVFHRVEWALPLVRINGEGQTLTCLLDSSSNLSLSDWTDLANGKRIQVPALDGAPFLLAGQLVFHTGGWRAAFDLFRESIRARYDLSQYSRSDLNWYREQLVQHFTFLYGSEILNLESGEFEIDRLLDDGASAFGGYDGILLWGGYPRLGIDERTQWDFYDDLPGGREALSSLVTRAHSRGVRVFVPFLPWDHASELAGGAPQDDVGELARLVSDLGADGVFLDTMSATTTEVRSALDRARPGVVFCSEGRPKGNALQVITGSWNQSSLANSTQGSWSAPPEFMPRVDLWRFIFPEHRQFVISRHTMGEMRRRVIQRGFFNAMGWVVWQDIFGLSLPWTPAEAAFLKKCRTLLRAHRSAVWSAHPTPLIETRMPGVYVNEFATEGKRMWTFYNDSSLAAEGPILQIEPRPDSHCVDIWNDREVELSPSGTLSLDLQPHSIGAVAEFTRHLDYSPHTARIEVTPALKDAVLEFVGAESVFSLPVHSASVELPHTRTPGLVRLIQNDEVYDQIPLHR